MGIGCTQLEVDKMGKKIKGMDFKTLDCPVHEVDCRSFEAFIDAEYGRAGNE